MQGIQIMATLYFIDPALGTFLTYYIADTCSYLTNIHRNAPDNGPYQHIILQMYMVHSVQQLS